MLLENKGRMAIWSPFRRRLLAFHQPSHLSNYMAFWVGFGTAVLMTMMLWTPTLPPPSPLPPPPDSHAASLQTPTTGSPGGGHSLSDLSSISMHDISNQLHELRTRLDRPFGLLPWESDPQMTPQPEPPSELDSPSFVVPTPVTYGVVPPIEKRIHQTWKTHTLPEGTASHTATWKAVNPGYRYKLYSDPEIEKHMARYHPEMMDTWAQLKPIEKADTFRYAILYDQGGFYSDIDVSCSRSIDEWSQNSNDYRNVDLIVGFEVVTMRPDWEQWYARKFQVCQWTIGGRAGHPVFRRVLDKIVEFFKDHTAAERKGMSVVQSTGPGIWSDAVLEYLDETYGAVFDDQDFISDKLIKFGPEKAREETLHVGSVLILPVRAFGMNSGGYASKPEHKFGDIFAQHYFQGSWKNKPQGGVVEDPTVYSPCHRHPIKSHELICGLSESPPTERALFAFDGRLDTKWLATADFSTGIEFDLAPKLLYTVCPSVEYDEYEKCNSPPDTALVISPAFSASRYSIAVASDFPGRDPTAWSLQASNDGDEWVTLDNQSSVEWEHRLEAKVYEILSLDAFTSYRLTVLNISDDSTGSTQIAEFWLENRPEMPPTTCVQIEQMLEDNFTDPWYPYRPEVCAYSTKRFREDPGAAGAILDKKLATEYEFEILPGTSLNFTVTNASGIEIRRYMLGTGTNPDKDPVGWELRGELFDAPPGSWMVLDEYMNYTFNDRSDAVWFDIPSHLTGLKFTTVTLSILGLGESETAAIVLSELEIAGLESLEVEVVTTTPPPTPPNSCFHRAGDELDEVVCYKGFPLSPENEAPPNAFDADLDTKWLGYFVDMGQAIPLLEDRAPQLSYSACPSRDDDNNKTLNECGDDREAFTAVAYGITSANDAPDRDPTGWIVQGYSLDIQDEGPEWVELDRQTGVVWAERKQTKLFPFVEPGEYATYRLIVLETAAAVDVTGTSLAIIPRSVQLAEFWLQGRPEIPAAPCVQIQQPTAKEKEEENESAARILRLPAQLEVCAYSTKGFREQSGAAGAVLDKNLATNYEFDILPGTSLNFTMANASRIVLRRYVIGTGANRLMDPGAWELIGERSNGTWTVIDRKRRHSFCDTCRNTAVWFNVKPHLQARYKTLVWSFSSGGSAGVDEESVGLSPFTFNGQFSETPIALSELGISSRKSAAKSRPVAKKSRPAKATPQER